MTDVTPVEEVVTERVDEGDHDRFAHVVQPASAVVVAVLAALAGALVVVFDAALAGAALVSLGAGAAPRTMSLKPLRGVMRAFLDALILIVAPVAGLRPMRALVWILANLAKPVMTTGS